MSRARLFGIVAVVFGLYVAIGTFVIGFWVTLAVPLFFTGAFLYVRENLAEWLEQFRAWREGLELADIGKMVMVAAAVLLLIAAISAVSGSSTSENKKAHLPKVIAPRFSIVDCDTVWPLVSSPAENVNDSIFLIRENEYTVRWYGTGTDGQLHIFDLIDRPERDVEMSVRYVRGHFDLNGRSSSEGEHFKAYISHARDYDVAGYCRNQTYPIFSLPKDAQARWPVLTYLLGPMQSAFMPDWLNTEKGLYPFSQHDNGELPNIVVSPSDDPVLFFNTSSPESNGRSWGHYVELRLVIEPA